MIKVHFIYKHKNSTMKQSCYTFNKYYKIKSMNIKASHIQEDTLHVTRGGRKY